MSVAAKRWIARVLGLPCLICKLMALKQAGRTCAHHIGDTAHRSDFLTIPLCHDHHQGGNGYHTLGAREFERRYKTTELHLLGETIRLLA